MHISERQTIIHKAPVLFACLAFFASLSVLCAAVPAPQGLGDELFTNAAVRHLRIEIPGSGINILRRYQYQRGVQKQDRPSVPAIVRENGQVWTNVAVHLKGALGSFQPVDGKPALTLNFDKFAKGQKFHGLEKISLNNSVQDPTYLNEKIAREIYNAAGVPVPRTDYATVELNGRQLGLYVLAEGWNKQFLARHFRNVEGNFYDPGGARDINKPMSAATGARPDDHSALQALVLAAAEEDHTERMARLEKLLDLDRFITLLALDALMWNWDGYAMNRNNYRIFHDLDAKRVVFFPHGVDQMFRKPNGPILAGRSGLLAKAIYETAEGRRRCLEKVAQLRSTVFDTPAIARRINELSARLSSVATKPGILATINFAKDVAVFRNRIERRALDVDQQLAGVKNLLQLKLDQSAPITNWTARSSPGALFTRPKQPVEALQLKIQEPGAHAWTAKVWLEEGRYVIEGRVKTRGAKSATRNPDDGAGFSVWSSRKATEGPSWGWFPFRAGDPKVAGLIPVFTPKEQRVTGDSDWTTVTHEFELRQPIADLDILCILSGSTGEAWFDLSSLKIRRTALNVSKAGG
jgi:spore coat protein H